MRHQDDIDRSTSHLLRNFTQKPRVEIRDGASYGTPYRHGETPIGENLEHGELPKSLRKTFRHHPEIAALSFLPDSSAYVRLHNDISTHRIQMPIMLWRTQRDTTDGRTVTEYFIVDGYLRMQIAEDLKLEIEDIPWMVNEEIHTLEDALLTATRLKMHRAHYNECERKYMIGLRYLQEKRRIGAPAGNQNAASPLALGSDSSKGTDDLDQVQTEIENNVENFSTLFREGDGDVQNRIRTSEILATDFGITDRTIRNYARGAQQLEIAVEAIQKRWKVSRGRAIRCCTQVHLVKMAGGQTLDARLVTSGDWARLDLQSGCFDRFPLVLSSQQSMFSSQRDKSHYHDDREQAIVAAVREIVTPPRMAPDVIDVEFSPVESRPAQRNSGLANHTAGRSGETEAELDERMFKMIWEQPMEERMKDPEFVAWGAKKREEEIQQYTNVAQTHTDPIERRCALRWLAANNQPLPTDELDPKVESFLRARFKPEESNDVEVLEQDPDPMEEEWVPVITATKEWGDAIRQYRTACLHLDRTSRQLLEKMQDADDLFTSGKIQMLSSWQSSGTKRTKEIFLEMAIILSDTTSSQQGIVVDNDATLQPRIKSTLEKVYDIFSVVAQGVDLDIKRSTRFKSHKIHRHAGNGE